MELGGFDPWNIVEYNNNFACPVNHQFVELAMMSHPIKCFHMSSLDRPTICHMSPLISFHVAPSINFHVDVSHWLIKFHVSLGDVPHRT
jgi:hypothetical protein